MIKKNKLVIITLFITFVITLALTINLKNGILAGGDAKEHIYLPILMYHQISTSYTKLGKFVVSPYDFERDVKLIKKYGYTPITMNDLIAWTKGAFVMPSKPIIITFDDGYESDYVYAFPILEKYNVKAVFSIMGSSAEKYSGDVVKNISYSYLNWDEIRQMQDSGLAEFQSHSYNLHRMNKNHIGSLKGIWESDWHYKKMILEDDDLQNQAFIDNNIMVPTVYTFPYGLHDDKLQNIIKDEGFKASLVTYEKVNILTGDPNELYNLKRFNRKHGFNILKILNNN